MYILNRMALKAPRPLRGQDPAQSNNPDPALHTGHHLALLLTAGVNALAISTHHSRRTLTTNESPFGPRPYPASQVPVPR